MPFGEQGSAVADVTIVGGGAAGCVLAAKLSINPATRVLLLEAGADVYAGETPKDIADTFPSSYFNDAYFWPGLSAHVFEGMPRVPITQARVLGGGSSVMGMWAVRGLPEDYDAWEAAGATGWSWRDVLPTFREIEHDLDVGGELHGATGPIPIRRVPAESWPPLVKAFVAAGGRHGLAQRTDLNGDFSDGVFPMPLGNHPSGRVSAAQGFLTDEVRRRPNLRILALTRVQRLLLTRHRATGIQVVAGNEMRELHTRNVVLAAGAILSPALLMHSGVGPAEVLGRLGIQVVHHLPGVGRRLQNHAVLNLAMPVRRFARQPRELRNACLACIRTAAGPPSHRGDINIHVVGITSPHAHGTRIGVVGVALYDPRSRGCVMLDSPDPGRPPLVDYGTLREADDRARLEEGVRLALRLLATPEFAAVRGSIIAVTPTAGVRRLNRMSTINSLISPLLAAMLDLPPALSDAVVRRLGKHIDDEALLDPSTASGLMPSVRPMSHPAGSCAMGAAGDPAAVVDPQCRVRGLENVFVVDASIMPSIPRGNTCIPTLMLAAHAAKRLLRQADAR